MNNIVSDVEKLKRALKLKRLQESGQRRHRSGADAAIGKASRDRPIPLAWAQQRLWFLDQLENGVGTAYHIGSGLRLCGTLDEAALRAALDRIVARHEVLRTRFELCAEQPVQVIGTAESGFALAYHDLCMPDAQEREHAVRRHAEQEAAAPFDLAAGPLVRGRLLRLSDQEHVLLVTMHHIVSDGWSGGVLVRELSTLYGAFAQGLPDPLPPLALQYADYAVWQREWLQGEELARQLGFWKGALAGAPALLELPTDRPRPALQSYAGATLALELPPALAADLHALAQRHGATLFMTLLTGWAILLARLSGQDDIVIGTPVANRQRAEIEPLVGFFVNTLALRISLDHDTSVAQLLARVKATALDAYAHQDLPFEQVVEALQPERSLSHSPLLQTMLSLNNTPEAAAAALPGLRLSGIATGGGKAHFDLSLAVSERGAGLSCVIDYSTALFEHSTVERIGAQLLMVLEAMAAAPQQPVGAVSLLTPAQRHQLVHAFNATPALPDQEHDHEQVLPALFERQAAATPDAPAVRYGEEQLSYAELNRRANRIAHRLLALGVRPDDRVAICAERGVDMVCALLGVLKSGAAYVPLDPDHPPQRLAAVIEDCAARALLSAGDLAARLPELAVPVLCVDDEAAFADYSNANPATALAPEHLAYVIYTSGSTGMPKGVMIEHRSAVNFWQVMRESTHAHCPQPARIGWNASYFFDMSLKGLLQLLSGHCMVIVPQLLRASGTELLKFLERERIDAIDCTPSQLELLLAAGLLERPGHVPGSVLLGGEALGVATWDKLRQASRTRFYNMYGPTECTVDATLGLVNGSGPQPHIGRPLANLQVYILDRQGAPAPLGVAGEIHIAGAGLARGYLNRPELDAARFLANPFGPGGTRMYRSGDLGRWRADGSIEYVGRNDHQVKLRGFRIELGEIEARLVACAGVREAVVLAREDAPGDRRLVAYLLAHQGQMLEPGMLREAMLAQLPEYMVPAAFVTLDAFPLTPNGKLDRKALPAPDAGALAAQAYAAPEGETETMLAALWCELLGVERVGRHDSFFALGGHSLLAVQLVARLRGKLGLDLSVRDIFRAPVLQALSAVLAGAGQREHRSIALADRSAPLPLSWSQQRLWFLDQLDHEASVAYHLPTQLSLRGKLDVTALCGALDRIVARHEVLRTRFVLRDEQPVQLIGAGDSGFALARHDLGALAPHERVHAVRRHAEEEAAAPFDLAVGPLVRGRLLRLGADDHVLLVTMHHIVSDGWSGGVLVRELSALYGAFALGQPDPLPPLALQYADYAVWQRGWLQGEELARQVGFWKQALAGAPALLELPTDRPRPALQSYAGAALELALPAGLTADLHALAQRHGATLFMTLLTGWAILLARLSGQDDIVIGTPVANRQRAEIEPLVGFFVNTLAVRVRLDDNPSVAQLLARVKATALDAYAHQDLPFEQVVEALQPVRSLGHSPLFQTMLALDNTPPGEALTMPGIEIGAQASRQNAARFDLVLSLTERHGRLAGSLYYASALFDAPTMRQVAGMLETILAAIAADSSRPVACLPLVDGPERLALLGQFSNVDAPACADGSVEAMFEARAAAHPDAVAMIADDRQWRYAELNEHADRLARRLLEEGVQPGQHVAVVLDKRPEMAVAMLAVLKAGAVYVPLDAAYPAQRIAFILDDCAPAAVLTHSSLAAATGGRAPLLLIDEALSPCAGQTAKPVPRSAGSDRPAYLIYTSGSTGQPKGVLIGHGASCRMVFEQIRIFDVRPDSKVLQFASLGFDASVSEMLMALCSGAALCIVPADEVLPGYPLTTTVRRYGITHLTIPPSALSACNHPGKFAPMTIIVAGEACPSELAESWSGHHRLINAYGPTEATVCASAYVCAGAHAGQLPIGRPLAHVRLYLLDQYRQPVPAGVAGTIHVGGAGVALGYLNRPELTAERFVPDPFGAGGMMYDTGDLGRWRTDGQLEYLGRRDFQVKIRGFRIEPGEIESRLNACAGVRQGLVVAREDIPGDKRLVAYLLAEEGADLVPAVLKAQLASELPEYMVPAAFVVLPAYPLGPNGKLDRAALPPPDMRALRLQQFEAPLGEHEEVMAGLWREILFVPRVGRRDGFFDLGGHSLLGVQLMSRVRSSFGVEMELRDLFASPTLAGFCALVAGARRTALPDIGRADRAAPLPLSWGQQRLWFIDALDHAAGAAYHMAGGIVLSGTLDRAALRGALDDIVERHEVLRSRIVVEDGVPAQLVDTRRRGFALREHDLGTFSGHERSAALERRRVDEASAPFDLAEGPPIRGQLLRLSDSEHVLLITQHHIVSDGWSYAVFLNELCTIYAARAAGLPCPLPPLQLQYADYAAWQRSAQVGGSLSAQLDFWKSHLAGAPPLLNLPTDFARPAIQCYEGECVDFALDKGLAGRVQAFCQSRQLTPFMFFLGAWTVLLARLSGQDDIVLGTPVANRPRTELEGLIGFFANTLALRTTLDADMTVAELLERVKRTTLDAYANQDVPFEQVVDALQPQRSLGHSPLFQVMLAYNNTPAAQAPALPGLTLRPLDGQGATCHFDLSLLLAEYDGNILGGLRYATSLFARPTVERMAASLVQVVEAMVAHADLEVDRIAVVTPAEQQVLLQAFNDTAVAFPAAQFVHRLVEQSVAAHPDRVALVEGEETLSYGALNARANRLARRLLDLGVQPDDRVALCCERSMDLIVGMLGILKAGAAYVPLDPSHPRERLAFVLADCAPAVLVAQPHCLALCTGAGVPTLVIGADADAADRSGDAPDVDVPGLRPSHLAYVIYTSGSTGQPKGSMNQHDGAVNRLLWAQQRFELVPEDCVVQKTPAAFDVSVWEIFHPLICGARLVIARPGGHQDAGYLAALMARHGVTVAHFVPSMLDLFVDAAPAGLAFPVRHLMCSGEALPGQLVARVRARWPACRLHNLYGPTEAAVDVTHYECVDGAADAGVPIGKPIANVRIYLLDRHGALAPLGAVGELCIAGIQVARAYWNRPGPSAERFVRDPFTDGMMFRTGDLARWSADGNLHYLGRNDFQVKIRGMRIELGEIEAALRVCAGVREAVVLAPHDAAAGRRLVAYIVPGQEAPPTPAALQERLAQCLPAYLVPHAYVMLESFPLSPNGKLDRAALPAPDERALATSLFAAPEGAAEAAVAEVWQALLKRAQVGRHDHFFRLGGHSLMVVEMTAELHKRGYALEVRTVFEHPVLSSLARQLAPLEPAGPAIPPNGVPADCAALTPVMLPLVRLTQAELDGIAAVHGGGHPNIQDIYPLAPLQHGILFHHMLGGAGDPYLLRSVMVFEERARLDQFVAALNRVIARHDILRSAFHWSGLAEPVQVVARHAELQLSELADTDGADPEQRLLHETDPVRTRIDLGRAPLIGARAARRPDTGAWVLSLLCHHMVCDHLTFELIGEEVAALLAGAPLAPVAPASYRDFVAAVSARSDEASRAYFSRELGDFTTPTSAFGIATLDRTPEKSAHHRAMLDAALAGRIRAAAASHGVSCAVLFHLGWASVLARCGESDDVVFGTVLSGRQHGDGAGRALGMFINTLPIRVSLDGADARQAVRRTYDALTGLLAHEQTSLAAAQRCSGVAAPAALFTSLFNFRHSGRRALAGSATAGSAADAWSGIRVLANEEHSTYPLSMAVDDQGDGFALQAQSGAVAPARLVACLAAAMHSLVEALDDMPGQAPGATLVSRDWLPAAELAALQQGSDAQSSDVQEGALSVRMLHELFEERVALVPARLAVADELTELSYEALNRRANRIAHRLAASGVGPGMRVALLAGRSVDAVAAILGIWKAGAAYVPLDTALPPARLAWLLADCAPAVVLAQAASAARLDQACAPVLVLDVPAEWQDWPEHDRPRDPGAGQAGAAYVCYTSGSTGLPKGVMVGHGSVLNLWQGLEQEVFAACAARRVALNAALSFDASVQGLVQLLSGRSLFLVPEQTRQDPGAMLAYLVRHRIDSVDCTPAQLDGLLAAGLLDADDRPRVVLVGGDAIGKAQWQAMQQARATTFFNVYGPTECTVDTTIAAVSGPVPHIGRPLANTRVYVLDRHGRPAPVGVVGELHVAGAGVAQGYLNRAELTAERFPADPFVPGARMYRTGDLARWRADGMLDYLGRNDFQLKIRGHRIEPGEIEARLMECAGVRAAAVLAREDVPGDVRLVAYLLAHAGQAIVPAALRAALREQLPQYMVPAAFVALDAFPLTPNGKLDRKALPVPDDAAVAAQAYQAPRGEAETAIAAVWRELLGLDQVGRHDDFFALGGHSLLAVQGVLRASRVLRCEVTLASLLANPVLHAFCAAVAQETAPGGNLVAIRTGGSRLPLFVVHPGGGQVNYARDLAHHLDPELPVYGLAATGLEQGETPLTSVPEMAAQYVRAMRAVQPQGPYRIAAWSGGGPIAYEMAHHLVAIDQAVGFLGLIDSGNNDSTLARASAIAPLPGDERGEHLDIATLLAWVPQASPALPALRALGEARDLAGMLAYCHAEQLLPSDIDLPTLRRHLRTRYAIVTATSKYAPPPMPVDLRLYTATEDERADPSLGWGAVAGPRLRIVPVGGNHVSIMKAPHVGLLGSLMSADIEEATLAARVPAYEPRITLHAGSPSVRPLFCVPGAGASVTAFFQLASALPADLPVHGLQPRGLCGELPPHGDVPAAARAYLQSVRAIAPHGPYRLMGHSFGGWVALEMARQLEQQNETVELLVLLDSEPPSVQPAPKRYGRAEVLMKLVGLFELQIGDSMRLQAADFEGKPESEQLALLLSRLVAAGLMPPRTTLKTIAGIVRVFGTNVNTAFQPAAPYGGTANVISIEGQETEAGGWREHAARVVAASCQGNHLTMLGMPFVAGLAGQLNGLLLRNDVAEAVPLPAQRENAC